MVFLKTEILVSHLLLLRLIFMIYFIILNFKDWFFFCKLEARGLENLCTAESRHKRCRFQIFNVHHNRLVDL